MKNVKPIFDAVRIIAGTLSQDDVDLLNKALIAAEHGDDLPKASARQIGKEGLELIKRWEGCRLKAYKDIVGVWTIGYGSTGPHVKPNMTITAQEAEDLLQKDLDRFEEAVDKSVADATQNEFDAMVSLAFNIGTNAFKNSTLVRRYNSGNKQGAADAFLMWVNAGGKKVKGLVNRRTEERKLFLS